MRDSNDILNELEKSLEDSRFREINDDHDMRLLRLKAAAFDKILSRISFTPKEAAKYDRVIHPNSFAAVYRYKQTFSVQFEELTFANMKELNSDLLTAYEVEDIKATMVPTDSEQLECFVASIIEDKSICKEITRSVRRSAPWSRT